MKKMLFVAASLLAASVALMACSKEGSAEKTGAKVDKTMHKVKYEAKDAVTADGPAEKMGKKLDKAGNAVSDHVKEATNSMKQAGKKASNAFAADSSK